MRVLNSSREASPNRRHWHGSQTKQVATTSFFVVLLIYLRNIHLHASVFTVLYYNYYYCHYYYYYNYYYRVGILYQRGTDHEHAQLSNRVLYSLNRIEVNQGVRLPMFCFSYIAALSSNLEWVGSEIESALRISVKKYFEQFGR